MALRPNYSSLDMIRMAKFAKENPNLKPIPLIKAYNEKYPEVTTEQKLKNVRNWLNDNAVMAVAEPMNESAVLPIDVVGKTFCSCEQPKPNYPEMVWCDNCGLEIKQT